MINSNVHGCGSSQPQVAAGRWQPERSYEPIIMLGLLTAVAVTAGLGHYDTVAFDHELSSSTPFT
jgi:hypothetical protein